MKNRLEKYLWLVIIFSAAVIFVIKFGGPRLLRSYIQNGIGDCVKIPILCMAPQDIQENLTLDNNYIQQLIPVQLPKTEVRVPKGFKVIEELVAKPYYKRKKLPKLEPVIYLLYQPPDFFINLFPQVKKSGIHNNYEFMRSLMHASESKIDNLNDAFFIIMKSIFTPDLGDQHNVKMLQFKWNDNNYFINYNLTGRTYFFDCTIITKNDDFFKVYIKDEKRELDLAKVFSILSTLSHSA